MSSAPDSHEDLEPLAPLADQYTALAQATARKLGKSVTVQAQGFEISTSNEVRDLLSMALLHGVRNAIDHSIEKSGTVGLKIQIHSGWIKLLIADNGKGPDLDRIREVAVKKKIIPANDSRSPLEILQLIFQPTFSTRDVSTETSGRGVGLDAVLTSALEQGGEVRARMLKPHGFVLQMKFLLRSSRLRRSPRQLALRALSG
jgi:chemotaxis protein histidine kinase CheA